MGNCCGSPQPGQTAARRNYRIRPAETTAAGPSGALPQNGKMAATDLHVQPEEDDRKTVAAAEEAEEEPNFNDEFDAESISNCSSWASGLSHDKTDRLRPAGKSDSMRAEGGSRLNLEEGGQHNLNSIKGTRSSHLETELRQRYPASRSSSDSHHPARRRKRRDRPNSLSVRQRGQFATPPVSPEEEIFWIPTSLARHMGYSPANVGPDLAATAGQTGSTCARYIPEQDRQATRDLPSISINERVVFCTRPLDREAVTNKRPEQDREAVGEEREWLDREAATVPRGELSHRALTANCEGTEQRQWQEKEKGLLEEVMDQLYDRPRSLALSDASRHMSPVSSGGLFNTGHNSSPAASPHISNHKSDTGRPVAGPAISNAGRQSPQNNLKSPANGSAVRLPTGRAPAGQVTTTQPVGQKGPTRWDSDDNNWVGGGRTAGNYGTFASSPKDRDKALMGANDKITGGVRHEDSSSGEEAVRTYRVSGESAPAVGFSRGSLRSAASAAVDNSLPDENGNRGDGLVTTIHPQQTADDQGCAESPELFLLDRGNSLPEASTPDRGQHCVIVRPSLLVTTTVSFDENHKRNSVHLYVADVNDNEHINETEETTHI